MTSEYVTESDGRGGAAHAVHKFAHGLRCLGCEPEVFVASSAPPGVFEHDGVRVQRVGYRVVWGARWRTWARRPGDPVHWLGLLGRPRPALNLADAWARRDAEAPFDLIVSMLVDASGVFVQARRGCPHVVRVTSSLEQKAMEWGGHSAMVRRLMLWLWKQQVRWADAVVAPSEVAARSIERHFGRRVHVVRTPVWQEVEPATSLPWPLPPRYLLHFGRLGVSKGTVDVAEALRRCWAEAPDLQMIWLGKEASPGVYARCQALWGADEQRVRWLGAVEQATLYAVLRGAVASVLPSRIDNLPNAAIESLMFGVPVIGTRGTSLDELIEHGRSGEIVEPASPHQLAEAMLRMWRGESPCQGPGFVQPQVFEEMQPEVAARRLIETVMAVDKRRA